MSSRSAGAANRLAILACAALVWSGLIVLRLAYLQILRHQTYMRMAEQQQQRIVELRVPRGRILDRAGRPLAISLQLDSVCINPMRAPDVSVAAGILCPILDLDREEFQRKLRWGVENHRGFLWVKRRISREESDRLRSLNLDWIEFRKESQRSYPKGPVGSHVIGAVDFNERGNAGIEQSLDDELRGQAGKAQVLADVRQRGINSHISANAIPGENITLTIDERIQFVAERELKKAVEAHHCDTGSVVVLDPHTGDILALASYPSFDANQPVNSGEDLRRRINHAVSVPFEPGSVFKVITLSAALETTDLRPETVVSCGGGRLNLFGRVIHDLHSYNMLTVADVLAKSSNIGAIQIGLKVGEEHLLEYVRRFGFGEVTSIPLPAESAGLVRDLEDWGRTSIGSVAMGHEISATAVQLAQAGAVIANDGLLIKPRLVLLRQRPGRPPKREPIAKARRVIRPETAITMRHLMEGVVLHGTGRLARLDGYSAGGKTGSAQIFDQEAGRYTHRYNASFLGFAPVPRPAVVVTVTLNGASQFGGVVAAPVFKEVTMTALRILDVPKDLPELPPPREDQPVELDDLAIAELGSPASVPLEPGVPDPHGNLEIWGPRVPDFYGKTMRTVLEEASARGLPVEFSGSGIVRAQAPAAGSILPPGARVRIQFAR